MRFRGPTSLLFFKWAKGQYDFYHGLAFHLIFFFFKLIYLPIYAYIYIHTFRLPYSWKRDAMLHSRWWLYATNTCIDINGGADLQDALVGWPGCCQWQSLTFVTQYLCRTQYMYRGRRVKRREPVSGKQLNLVPPLSLQETERHDMAWHDMRHRLRTQEGTEVQKCREEPTRHLSWRRARAPEGPAFWTDTYTVWSL